jgi:glycosyltransferase involved in cell wall biosynthesis
MYHEASIGVVVPCHNEQLLITRVLDTMPDYVDYIYVVDDVSSDNTVQAVEDYISSHNTTRVKLLKHSTNKGVGGAIVTGYKQAAQDGVDVIAVMAGDAQTAIKDLSLIIDPVVDGQADYTKSNRMASGEAWNQIPRLRYIGNIFLALMTKVASGYWHISDPQTSYTAISRKAIQTIPLDDLSERYGYTNHLLIMLNIYNFPVADVPVEPVYGIAKRSAIHVGCMILIPAISLLLLRGFIHRLFYKYVVLDAHPLVLFYLVGALTFIPGLIFGFALLYHRLFVGNVAATSAIFAMFLVVFGVNFLLFAMWFDMNANKHLKP